MLVTKLEVVDKKRAKVYIDEAYAFVLYSGEIREYGIAEGEELTPEKYDEIVHTLLPKRAILRAMHLLTARPYTEYQLRTKLTDGYYTEKLVDAAIAYVKSYGYLDDAQYAYDYASYHAQDKPKGRIRTDLLQKGVAKDLVEVALARAYAEAAEGMQTNDAPAKSVSPELLLLQKELRKRHYDPETSTYEERQKLKAALYRKGFSADVIDTGLQKS